VQIFRVLNFFAHDHKLATDSKSTPISLPHITKRLCHVILDTQHSKINGIQIQPLSRIGKKYQQDFFLFKRLSLVRSLLLAKRHKNMCRLGGTDIFHITRVYTCLIPLSLMIAYIVCIEYFPEEANCHIMASSSSLNWIPLRGSSLGAHLRAGIARG
jgi:hypothetical protein